MMGEEKQLSAPGCSAHLGPGKSPAVQPSQASAQKARGTRDAGCRETRTLRMRNTGGRCERTLRSRIIDAPFWGPLGVLANAVSGPIGSPETSVGPPRSYSLQCGHWIPGAGCDVAEEEEGRGGAWRGDVLPRWRRESEEIFDPLWVVTGEFCSSLPARYPGTLQTLGHWKTDILVFELRSGRRCSWKACARQPRCWPWLQPLLWEFRGVGSWAKGRAAEAGRDRLLLLLSDATSSGEGE